MGKSFKLTYKDSNGRHCSHDLGGEAFKIGRLGENDLSFDNPYISRFHVEISFDGAAYTVRDLDSTSGTFVNEQRVKSQILRDGDRIRLGRGRGVEFVFRADEATDGQDQGTTDSGAALSPVRVIVPEEARFINTARLPQTGLLRNDTFERLRALYEFTSELLTAHSAKELGEKLAAFLHRVLKAERCAVLMRDHERGIFQLAASFPPNVSFTPSRSITRQVYNDNVAILSFDARADARFSGGESVKFQSIRSVMCAPMGSHSRVWGICYVDNLTTSRVFDDEELDFLTAVGRQAGLAMENLYLLDEQRRSLESFIRTLAASLDARDDSTAGHSARVGAFSAGIARTMGLAQNDSRLIYYAGLLHDYGKIGIRDDVLLKPARLTPEEYEHVKEHPLHTFRLLSKIRLPEDLSDIPFVAAAHHERWDGTGYPHGLKGEEIPLGSRIVSVADAYDALTEERVYQEPWSPERAMEEVCSSSGRYFDPEVVEAFNQYFTLEIEPRYRRKQKGLRAE